MSERMFHRLGQALGVIVFLALAAIVVSVAAWIVLAIWQTAL